MCFGNGHENRTVLNARKTCISNVFGPSIHTDPCPSTTITHPGNSSNGNFTFLRKAVLRDLQIQRRRPLSRPARDVVVRAVAGAEPASEVAGFANGDAAEVGADACVKFTSVILSIGGVLLFRSPSGNTYPA